MKVLLFESIGGEKTVMRFEPMPQRLKLFVCLSAPNCRSPMFFFSNSTHLFYDPIDGVDRIIDFFLSTFYKLKALEHVNFTVSGSIL